MHERTKNKCSDCGEVWKAKLVFDDDADKWNGMWQAEAIREGFYTFQSEYQ